VFDSRLIPVVLPKDPIRKITQELPEIGPVESTKEHEVVANDTTQESELAKTLTGVLAKLTAIPNPTDDELAKARCP